MLLGFELIENSFDLRKKRNENDRLQPKEADNSVCHWKYRNNGPNCNWSEWKKNTNNHKMKGDCRGICGMVGLCILIGGIILSDICLCCGLTKQWKSPIFHKTYPFTNYRRILFFCVFGMRLSISTVPFIDFVVSTDFIGVYVATRTQPFTSNGLQMTIHSNHCGLRCCAATHGPNVTNFIAVFFSLVLNLENENHNYCNILASLIDISWVEILKCHHHRNQSNLWTCATNTRQIKWIFHGWWCTLAVDFFVCIIQFRF